MIDHTGFKVSNFAKSREFYEKALDPLNYELMMQFPSTANGPIVIGGFGEHGHADFWISEGPPNQPNVHVAFKAADRQMVDAFYKAAIAAGGHDNGAPGLRPKYHSNYYAAFVLDPDGHSIEAVCHNPA